MDEHPFVHLQHKKTFPLVHPKGCLGEFRVKKSSNLNVDCFFLKEKGGLVLRKE